MIKLSHKQAVVVGLGANPVSVVGDDGEVEVEVAAVGVVLQLVYNVDGTVLCRDRDRPSGRSRHRARSLASLKVLLEDLKLCQQRQESAVGAAWPGVVCAVHGAYQAV